MGCFPAVSRYGLIKYKKGNAEDGTNRVDLQSHRKFQAALDFYTLSNTRNNLICISRLADQVTVMFCKLKIVRNGDERSKIQGGYARSGALNDSFCPRV